MTRTFYLIICRSLTYAQRSARALERAGITAVVMKTPKNISTEGCGYCVKVSEKRLSQALTVLKNAGMGVNRVYVQNLDGSGSEVQL